MGSNTTLDPTAWTWQASLRDAIRSVDELLELLGLSADQLPQLDRSPDFPLLVPREYVQRMERFHPQDPLLLQVLPLAVENQWTPGFHIDAVGDHASTQEPGVLHKYQSRALLIATGLCAVHCTYNVVVAKRKSNAETTNCIADNLKGGSEIDIPLK